MVKSLVAFAGIRIPVVLGEAFLANLPNRNKSRWTRTQTLIPLVETVPRKAAIADGVSGAAGAVREAIRALRIGENGAPGGVDELFEVPLRATVQASSLEQLKSWGAGVAGPETLTILAF